MKKKIVGRLGVVALALTLITMTLTGGTLAKYTAEVTGTATAAVAKFAFDLNGATEQTEKKTISFDTMFSNSYNDGKVSADASKKVVAPGTSGKVEIKLQNKGEVEIEPDFTITETNAGSIPLQYAINDSATAPAADAADWKAAADLSPTETEVAVSDTQTFYLHWRWDPKSTDEADTKLGIKSTLDTAELEIKCTVSQVVPAA